MIKSFLQGQKPFMICGLSLFIGMHDANKVCIANPRKVEVFETHQALPNTPSISLEKNVLLVGIKPYLGKETLNENISPALKLLSNGRNLILKDADGVVKKG